MMTLGETIKYYRQKYHLTQDELAARLNTTPQNIYKYEKGIITNIPLSAIMDLAKFFDIPPAKMVGWDEDDAVIPDASALTAEKSALSKRIATKREKTDYDSTTIASILGISTESYNSFENGTFDKINFSLLCKLALLLKTSPEYLLGISDSDEKIQVELSELERCFVLKYRSNPEIHKQLHKLLDMACISDKEETTNVEPIDEYAPLSPDFYDNPANRLKIAQSLAPYYCDDDPDKYE